MIQSLNFKGVPANRLSQGKLCDIFTDADRDKLIEQDCSSGTKRRSERKTVNEMMDYVRSVSLNMLVFEAE